MESHSDEVISKTDMESVLCSRGRSTLCKATEMQGTREGEV